MKKIALIGESISHSLSPSLFKAAFSNEARDGKNKEFVYNLLDYPTLKEAMAAFLSKGYYGANITSPYKEEILSYCTELDISARESGAVNLILKSEGGIRGYNTDPQGIYTPLKIRGIKPCNAIIVGTGGAAKAAVYILTKKGYNVTIVNRTLENAKKLAMKHSAKWAPIKNLPELFTENKLLIYTIGAEITSLEKANLEDTIIFEANYKNPSLNNKLCKEYIPGIEWLIYQAVPSFKLFTDIEPNIYAMLKLTNSH